MTKRGKNIEMQKKLHKHAGKIETPHNLTTENPKIRRGNNQKTSSQLTE